jgi:WD40 repeat protein
MSRLGVCVALLFACIAALHCGAAEERTRLLATEVLTIRGHSDGEVCSLSFSPDSKLLASGGGDETMKVWDAATGKQLFSKTQKGIFSCVAFSSNGKRLVSACGAIDQPVKVWEVATGNEVLSLETRGCTNSVAFSPDGKNIAANGSILGKQVGEGPVGGQMKLWDTMTGKLVQTINLQANFANSVAFSPDGKWLAAGTATVQGQRGEIVLWELATGKELRTLKAQAKGAPRIVFSPDGKRLAAAYGGDEGALKLWDPASGKELLALGGKESTTCLAISPNGKWIASGGFDETVKVWDAATGREILSVKAVGEANDRFVYSVAFSPDGKRLAVGDRDGVVRVWKLTE